MQDTLTPPTAESNGMTRRQLLTAATASGAALAAGALGGGAVGALATQVAYELELKKLRTLVALYEQLEKVRLDAVIVTGAGIVRGSLETLKAGIRLVRDGIAATQAAFKTFQDALEGLRQAAANARTALGDLQGRFRAAESTVAGVLGTTRSLADAVRDFFSALVDKIPFGIGDNIRGAIDALVNLVRGVPTAIDTTTSQLLQSLDGLFWGGNGKPTVQTGLFDPITNSLLQPLTKFLNDVETAIDRWEGDFSTQVQGALEQRAQIRSQIEEYRRQNRI